MTLITQDRLDELVRLCKLTETAHSAELGVYKGGSLKLLAENFPDRSWFGFDTFKGLPKEHWNENEVHQPGDFNDNSIDDVYNFINRPNVLLVEGLFPETAKTFDFMKFSFVHVDFDFYEGARSAIEFFYPRLVPGGIMVFDDYLWENCPGVKRALDESGIPYQPTRAKYQAYLIKE